MSLPRHKAAEGGGYRPSALCWYAQGVGTLFLRPAPRPSQTPPPNPSPPPNSQGASRQQLVCGGGGGCAKPRRWPPPCRGVVSGYSTGRREGFPTPEHTSTGRWDGMPPPQSFA